MTQHYIMKNPETGEVKKVGLNEWGRYRRNGWKFAEAETEATLVDDDASVDLSQIPDADSAEDSTAESAPDDDAEESSAAPAGDSTERFEPASKKKASKKKASAK